MYHVEKKEVRQWKTIYSVVRDLEVLIQVYNIGLILYEMIIMPASSTLRKNTLMLNQVMLLILSILFNQMEFFNYIYKLHCS